MAGRTTGFHEQEKRILIAVETDFEDALGVAGGSAFVPEFLAAAAPEDGFATAKRISQRCFVHVRQHEHLLGVGILDDGGDEGGGIPADGGNFSFIQERHLVIPPSRRGESGCRARLKRA